MSADPHNVASLEPPLLDPAEAARAAQLRYVSDDRPGIRRRRAGRGFTLLDPRGQSITDPRTRERVARLAIPPAWKDVWICSDPRGHLQATGRDGRGRKQYLYHPRFREQREQGKFDKMILFARALPAIRAGVRRDLRRRRLERDKVLATVVRLLEITLARVGNDRYRRSNRSYGLTTLRKRHVAIRGGTIQLTFRGKRGKLHTITAADRQAAEVVRRLQELPGQELFQWVDASGERRSIDSGDVNAYVKQLAGEEFSAKDFRTWAGTLAAARALREAGCAASKTAAARNIKAAVAQTAELLGNTPAICRKAYIHPAILEAHRNGTLLADACAALEIDGLSDEECELLGFLLALREQDNNDPAEQRIWHM